MRPGKKREEAHSLIELMVASTLFLLLMTAVVSALYYCHRYMRNAETKIEAQAEALNACMYLSRNLTESNVTATCTTANVGVSFPSPRDPANGDVAWDPSGALMWKEMRFCYLETDADNVSVITMKAFPLTQVANAPSVVWSGFPPFPASGTPDLPPPQPVATGMALPTPISRRVARNIRQLQIDVYQPNDPNPTLASTANISVEAFAPYYSIDYGVTVTTSVRFKN